MTHHLTEEQLGATRDGALSAADTAAAERHLAGCAGCRERLADLVALDEELSRALEHDPGEAYFASFADRVGARIAGGAPATAPDAAAPRRGFAAWWGSPRRLAWAGGALGLVAVAALVTTLARDHGPQELARQGAPARELGVAPAPPRADSPGGRASKSVVAAPPPAPAPTPAPAAAQVAQSADAGAPGSAHSGDARAREDAAAQPQADVEVAAPKHVVEVRPLPNGEQEIVARPPLPAATRAPAPQAPGWFSKPPAEPQVVQSLEPRSIDGGVAANKSLPEPRATPAPAAPLADTRPGAVAEGSRDAVAGAPPAGFASCGRVGDSRGRPAVRALVMVAETGATATAGPDGEFCVDVPATGGTLAVLAVGYRPERVHVLAADAAKPVAIVLDAVEVLKPLTPSGKLQGFTGSTTFSYVDPEPPSLARRSAIDASAYALWAATAGAWTTAAERWETVALLEPQARDAQPGFRVAEARVNAWLIGRGDAQRAAARAATRAFLEHAPEGTMRDIARDWNRALER